MTRARSPARGRLRGSRRLDAVFGALLVPVVALGVGTLETTRPRGVIRPMSASSPNATTVTTTTATTTTCTVTVVPPTPVNRVVTTVAPIVATGVADDGTQFNVTVGTQFHLRLVPNGVATPGCAGFPWGPSTWETPAAAPAGTLQLTTREQSGGDVFATVVVVGAGQGTISSNIDCAGTCSPAAHWSISVHADAASRYDRAADNTAATVNRTSTNDLGAEHNCRSVARARLRPRSTIRVEEAL